MNNFGPFSPFQISWPTNDRSLCLSTERCSWSHGARQVAELLDIHSRCVNRTDPKLAVSQGGSGDLEPEALTCHLWLVHTSQFTKVTQQLSLSRQLHLARFPTNGACFLHCLLWPLQAPSPHWEEHLDVSSPPGNLHFPTTQGGKERVTKPRSVLAMQVLAVSQAGDRHKTKLAELRLKSSSHPSLHPLGYLRQLLRQKKPEGKGRN